MRSLRKFNYSLNEKLSDPAQLREAHTHLVYHYNWFLIAEFVKLEICLG